MFDCEICRVKLNGEAIREAHIKGAKHQKKLKAQELLSLADQDESIVKTEDNNVFSCKVCDIFLNSQMQLKAHLDGSKHQAKVGQAGPPKMKTESGLQMTPISISAVPPPAPTQNKGSDQGATKPEYYCAHCDVHANSDVQYQQHMSSQKHLNKVNLNGRGGARAGRGKPYNRSQFTNNGYSAPGNNGYSAPGNNSYGGPAKPAFRGSGPKGHRNPQMGILNGGYRFPYNYNGGYPRSRGGAQVYPAGFNGGNYFKGGPLPSMSTFFPRPGAV